MSAIPDPQDLGGEPPAGLSGQALNSWKHARERRETTRKFIADMRALGRLVLCLHLRRLPATADIETVAAFANMDVSAYLAERAERVAIQGNLTNQVTYHPDVHVALIDKERREQARYLAARPLRGPGFLPSGLQVSDGDDPWAGDAAHDPEMLRRLGVHVAPRHDQEED